VVTTRQIYTGRAFDRLVNFSDAVVAVAITVLVLPITSVVVTSSEQTVWQVLGDHSGQIISFAFTFAVVGVMWWTHNRIFNQLRGFDTIILWLNLAWLLAIAFLPVSSYLYGGSDFNSATSETDLGGAGLLYWGSLATVTLWGSLISTYASHKPELIDKDAPGNLSATNRRVLYRGWIYTAFFLIIGLVSLVAPQISAWMPLGLIIVGRVTR
jgi:uncharacterized membrane protein